MASHLLEDKKSVLVGTGLPMIAALLAQRTHAPGLLIIFEAGGIGPRVPTLPISVGDSRTFYHAAAASSMHDVMSACQAGYVDYGFLGAAMIDRYGNINTTVIGEWDHPTVRLPGSGGANDIGSLCHRTIIIMRQDKRKFVERVNFITTPGYLDGAGCARASRSAQEQRPVSRDHAVGRVRLRRRDEAVETAGAASGRDAGRCARQQRDGDSDP